jgi:hypothetical protein
MTIGRNLSRFFDLLGELLAVLTIMLIAFLFLNTNFNFVGDSATLNMLTTIRDYAILGTLIIVGLEFSVKRSFVWFVIFLILAAIAVLFTFFPQALPPFLKG